MDEHRRYSHRCNIRFTICILLSLLTITVSGSRLNHITPSVPIVCEFGCSDRKNVHNIHLHYKRVQIDANDEAVAGIFQLRLRSFESGDDSSIATNHHRTKFHVCLKQFQYRIDLNTESCIHGNASVTIDARRIVNGTSIVDIPIYSRWPITFTLIVEAWRIGTTTNTTASSDDARSLIMRLAGYHKLQSSDVWTTTTTTTNVSDDSSSPHLTVDYRVRCSQHFYGADCNTYCRPRAGNVNGYFSCSKDGAKVCNPGWSGVKCDQPVCSKGCLHGDCVRPNVCECHKGYMGESCSQCQRYPSCKHGTCDKTYECNCDEGWGGVLCNQDLNYCTRHKPCMNGAICTNQATGYYTCTCQDGFTGTNCEVRINDCSQRPCQNGGFCKVDAIDGYKCHCPQNVSGQHCQITATSCDDAPCMNGATCVTGPYGGYKCLCTEGWQDNNCDIEKNGCHPNPCKNDGRCVVKGPNSYACVCPAGFDGLACEHNIDDCMNDACQNGGTCIDEISQFRCRCAEGFTGSLCQTEVDECATLPCANGGTCFDGVNGFRCRCQAGYTGETCTDKINHCSVGKNRCLNGGVCIDRVSYSICDCPACFTGQYCRDRSPECIIASNHSTPAAATAAVTIFDQHSTLADGIVVVAIACVMVLFVITILALLAVIIRQHKRSSLSQPAIASTETQQNIWNADRQFYNNSNISTDRQSSPPPEYHTVADMMPSHHKLKLNNTECSLHAVRVHHKVDSGGNSRAVSPNSIINRPVDTKTTNVDQLKPSILYATDRRSSMLSSDCDDVAIMYNGAEISTDDDSRVASPICTSDIDHDSSDDHHHRRICRTAIEQQQRRPPGVVAIRTPPSAASQLLHFHRAPSPMHRHLEAVNADDVVVIRETIDLATQV